MRMIKKLFILCFFLVIAASCETYKDYEMEYSPIYPLSGEWVVKFTDTSVTPNVTSTKAILSTYNTADNNTSQMWIRSIRRIVAGDPFNSSDPSTGSFTGKINCIVSAKTFSGENIVNTSIATAPPTFTISEGTIVIDGYDTATKGKADKITFKMTDTRKPGIVYTVTGFRRTRWIADEV